MDNRSIPVILDLTCTFTSSSVVCLANLHLVKLHYPAYRAELSIEDMTINSCQPIVSHYSGINPTRIKPQITALIRYWEYIRALLMRALWIGSMCVVRPLRPWWWWLVWVNRSWEQSPYLSCPRILLKWGQIHKKKDPNLLLIASKSPPCVSRIDTTDPKCMS